MMKAESKSSHAPALAGRGIFEPTAGNATKRVCLLLLLTCGFLALLGPERVFAQEEGEGYAIWGEVKITETTGEAKASVTIALYKVGSGDVGRRSVSNGGRYRFTGLGPGDYDVVVEAETVEVTRVRISILPGTLSPFYGFRQDFEFKWKSGSEADRSITGVISAADVYDRPAANKPLFRKAQEAVEKKKYEQAVGFLRQIVESDKLDFQVWTLLGTIYLTQEKPAEAEKAYQTALGVKPTFVLALLNLGRLLSSQKRFEEAIDPLTRAVTAQPQLADANLLLGEAYLQVRKGSKAIPYLNEAARLGRPEAHLRLGWLYNAAGMKDKAAAEYEEFLKKRPDYSERKKLTEYIRDNRKG
ncbi:MAG TPA: tetratricopeptide repeat protein [Pyrinomonadaceae bacterium]|jgi:tetratricopeptide (TPR) repeat protein